MPDGTKRGGQQLDAGFDSHDHLITPEERL